MLGNRLSQHKFSEIPDVRLARSKFDRSFTIKDTFNFDYLVPIYVDEVIPGDTFNLTVASFARIATQIVPVMDNLYMDYFFFFVPNRLTYANWEKLNGAQDNPGDSTSYIMPSMPFGAGLPDVDTIYDKFGLPTDIAAGYSISNTLPLRCYNLIWNEWFRDQNLQNSVLENTDGGPDAYADYNLLKRGVRHDYFMSCLPTPQKGTAVTLPLGTSADVWGSSGNATGVTNTAAPVITAWVNSTTTDAAMTAKLSMNQSNTAAWTSDPATPSAGNPNFIGYKGGITTAGATNSGSVPAALGFLNKTLSQAFDATAVAPFTADLTNATAATINQLRQAFMMQSLLELDNRGGTRYVEILRAHFGVTSPDFRLQRPEYLGGGSVPINVNPVTQTAPTSGSNYLAQTAAFATATVSPDHGIGFSKSFVEHGYIIGLACGRADITYQQGLEKLWSRSTRYDFFWPKLQELGEQSVLNKEIYLDGSANDDLVFGYQERYAEYRYKPSQIKGQFRSTFATPIDQWHMGIKFTALPVLNSTLIQQNTPITRALANSAAPQILFDCFFKLTTARPMMTYGVPATLGRF